MRLVDPSRKSFLLRWQAKLADRERPVRFVIAAISNTLFGFAVYPLLLLAFEPLRRHYMIALGIAQALSLTFAFCTYKLGVFRTRSNLLREISAFLSFYGANYAANWIALPLLVEAASLSPVIAQLLFSVILMLGSYFWHSRVTFRPAGTET